jgi:phosphatidylglycerophosphate synthase
MDVGGSPGLVEHKQLDTWSNFHALVMLAVIGGAAIVHSYLLLISAVALSFMLLISMHRQLLASYRPFAGYANWLTFARLCLLLIVFSNIELFSLYLFCVLMALVVALDVVDGYLARRFNTLSTFGGAFDMEVDAFFVSVMGLYFYFSTDIGIWLLLPGLLRYAYRLTIWAVPYPLFRESKKSYAAFFAGLNFVLLVLAIVLPVMWQTPVLIASILIVAFSFSVSFYEYFSYAKNH